LDNVLEEISAEDLQHKAEDLLNPVLEAIQKNPSINEAELLGMLADIYPQMQEDSLREQLAHLFFIADTWGRLSVLHEIEGAK
jgi:phage gp29-like protein